MKKSLILLVALLFGFNAYSQPSFLCNYVDYFHLNTEANPWILISMASADQEVLVQVISPKSFKMRDAGNCNSGYGHVTFAYDRVHWCILDIKDGPYMWHPSVNAHCSGLRYKGLDYDGDNSYTINIE
jgi:hypothetical protein